MCQWTAPVSTHQHNLHLNKVELCLSNQPELNKTNAPQLCPKTRTFCSLSTLWLKCAVCCVAVCSTVCFCSFFCWFVWEHMGGGLGGGHVDRKQFFHLFFFFLIICFLISLSLFFRFELQIYSIIPITSCWCVFLCHTHTHGSITQRG